MEGSSERHDATFFSRNAFECEVSMLPSQKGRLWALVSAICGASCTVTQRVFQFEDDSRTSRDARQRVARSASRGWQWVARVAVGRAGGSGSRVADRR